MPDWQIIIIGTGPAGLSAASTLAGSGLKVLMLEESRRPGGQFLRPLAKGPQAKKITTQSKLHKKGEGLLEKAVSAGFTYRTGLQVLGLEKDGSIWGTDDNGAVWQERGEVVILATGARERFLPFKGWTLPGVMSTGAAQILLKAGGVLAGPKVLIGGSGPLPLTLASQYLMAGGKLAGFWDQTSLGAKLGILKYGFSHLDKIMQGAGGMARLLTSGAAYMPNCKVIECQGQGRLERAVLARMDAEGKMVPGSERSFEVDCLAMGHGFTPNLELPTLAGCELALDTDKGGWVVKADQGLNTSLEHYLAAGEITGVAGVEKSYLEGRMAALTALHRLGKLADDACRQSLNRLSPKRERQIAFGAFLNRLSRPSKAMLDDIPDEAVICRCEDVTMGQVREQAANGFVTLDAIKKTTTSTMGNCQGRTCGPVLLDALAAMAGENQIQPGPLSIRTPVKPVALAALADFAEQQA